MPKTEFKIRMYCSGLDNDIVFSEIRTTYLKRKEYSHYVENRIFRC